MPENSDARLFKLAEEFRIGRGINPDEQINMLNHLEKSSKEEIIDVLNFFVVRESNPKMLFHIVKMIEKYHDKKSVNPLIDLLLLRTQENLTNSNDFLNVRCLTAKVLGNLKDNNAVFPLLFTLNNKGENYKLRFSAAEALGRIGDKYAVAPLIEVVSDEEEKSVYLRESAAKALGLLGDSRASEPLLSVLETKKGIMDKFTFLKERLIEAIGKLGLRDSRTIKTLSNSLLDESATVRLGAIEALAELSDDRVIPLIEKMIDDDEEEVARCAINELYNVAGKNYIIKLLSRDNLPGWCREEIETIIEGDGHE